MQPHLHTTRFDLRPLQESDFRLFADLAQNPVVMRYIRPAETSDAESRRYFDISLAMPNTPGHGMWVVSERSTQLDLGWVFLKPDLEGLPCHEIGYRYAQEAWGKGVASEVAIALAEHARQTLGVAYLVGLTHLENEASKRVLAKAGLQQASGTYALFDTEVHVHTWGELPDKLASFFSAQRRP